MVVRALMDHLRALFSRKSMWIGRRPSVLTPGRKPASLRCRPAPSRISSPSNTMPLLRWKRGDMAASTEERIRQLTGGMLRKRLYVILSKGAATAEQIGAVLPDHLEYMIGLEKRGVLFASGPLGAAAGAPAGDGLTVLRAA